MKSIAYELFKKNNEKASDLFGKEVKAGVLTDADAMSCTTYKNYYALFSEIMKAYKPAPNISADGESSLGFILPEDLTKEEQKNLEEMIEAILDIIHYAKHKGDAK